MDVRRCDAEVGEYRLQRVTDRFLGHAYVSVEVDGLDPASPPADVPESFDDFEESVDPEPFSSEAFFL
jgi:hypothetical protein